ncbi:MAG TPA: bifunctional riboflavin kinase/FAD synthetase [bacterium]|mgnify:CR=1 FL=1|nr:bifunctional riboflavin kinase/FAD synthetase [bacterium]
MKIYRSLEEIPFEKETCLTLGTFDGIHLGHQEIIRSLTRAVNGTGRSVLLTFSPHPQKIVGGDDKLCLLTTLEEKQHILKSLGIDALLIMSFNPRLASQPPRDFIMEIVRNVGVRCFFIGFNHAFGKDRTGDEKLLNQVGDQCGFKVAVIPPVLVHGETVSSTRIRRKLHQGLVQEAALMLGRPYCVEGKVVRGHGLGHRIGFPTANIRVSDRDKLIPGHGVYAVQVHYRRRSFSGMCYIGFRPTVNGHSKGIEVHVLGTVEDLYQQRLRVLFLNRIREEKKFESVDRLREQINEDKLRVKQLLSSVNE